MNRFGLIGYPLGHSFSQQFFNNKFKTENLTDCFFDLFPIENVESFPELLNAHKDFKGLAVTIPYKQTIINFLTSIDEAASEIGAVNCIKISSQKIIGFNTDVIGFENSIKQILKPVECCPPPNQGCKTDAKAVQFVFKKLGIEFLLVSRSKNQQHIQYQDINELICDDYNIIVNATPVGMAPNNDKCPEIPYQFLSEKHLLFDLIYNPSETLFLQKGREAGAQTKNGHEMLITQAEANWKIWNQ
ncbi:MAG: shikimate dehydrogenase [Sphingobacteriales bacterium]|nr:shikimate dehydrogenase [Sphingobacteriales bacterium]